MRGCRVRVVITLDEPGRPLDLLEVVARRYDLDGTALLAAAKAALVAPDRVVTMDLSESFAA